MTILQALILGTLQGITEFLPISSSGHLIFVPHVFGWGDQGITFDVIVHLAANTGVGPSVENPRLDCFTNVIGTFNYLDAARVNNIPRFIFASSGAPAGEVEPPIHEELPPHPVSPYGASKLAGEGYCSAYNKSFGIDTSNISRLPQTVFCSFHIIN